MNTCDCSIYPDDFEHASVSTTSTCTARKQHTCCECGLTIEPREQYEHVKGCWDGQWSTHKTCSPCVEIRTKYCPCGWLYGELRETLWECLGIDYVDGREAGWAT